MSEVHRPGSLPKSIAGLLGEVGMISLAVFIGLLADQWRESRHHEEQARSALRNFRSEVLANQKEIERVKTYHETIRRDLISLAAKGGSGTPAQEAHFDGIHPIYFEHTAWDLAVATQALSYIDTDLAYAISRIYTHQQAFETLEKGFTQSAFGPSSFLTENRSAVIEALVTYLNDVVIQEPLFLKQYDAVVPQINLALSENTPSTAK